MSDARDAVLAAVRRSLAARGDPGVPPAVPVPAALPDNVNRFAERAAEYRAEVHRIHEAGVIDLVAEVCSRQHVSRLACPPDVPDRWRPAGITLLAEGLPPSELDRVDGVLTGCSLAIAETGTVALDGGAHQGARVLTLVPDLHICVVLSGQVVARVDDAMSRLGASVRERNAPITLISGPSATSDIELSRIEGVHGPRRLVIVLAEQ
jgi:L-lactate dehydrogenase complex protein LldG